MRQTKLFRHSTEVRNFVLLYDKFQSIRFLLFLFYPQPGLLCFAVNQEN